MGKRSQGAEFVLAGSAACAAITFCNPIDVVKTRLQLQGELAKADKPVVYRGIGRALWQIGSTEGLHGLQRGLGAAYLLQFSNVGCRFGGYSTLKHMLGINSADSALGWLSSLALGGASGVLAAVVSNPFFLLKTRFQAAGAANAAHQHEHATLRAACASIWHSEGFGGYYRGLTAFVPRVAAASSVQLSTYDVAKANIMRWAGAADSAPIHFASSLVTGVAVTLAMQPFDFAAVRLMSQPVDSGGRGALYSGPFDCIVKTVRAEGFLSVYKGGLANYLRFGPYCILTFVFLEQFRAAWDGLVPSPDPTALRR